MKKASDGRASRSADKTTKVIEVRARKGKRAKITPEMKAQVKTMVEQQKSGTAIAKELGISLPSVQNIKKELGLVKPRKK